MLLYRRNRAMPPKVAMTIRPSFQLSTRSTVRVPAIMTVFCTRAVKLLFRDSAMVSMSLVNRLISSPWVLESK